ncbi:transglycosylase SLT domain-containing protein [Pseudonocardia sp. CA-107938]|uniref:transglycosylase SLT domain-containing protein n=1 Tax=Pseudonocardia sp. CA-107938 TaxID=3240021 RepID=UPI003D948505
MAGHRSPRGERADWYAQAVANAPLRESSRRARHNAAHRPAPAGPSLRTTVVAGAAAAGAVATGTFTALIPAAGTQNLASSAAAEESSVAAALAANTSTLAVHPAANQDSGFFAPVMFDDSDGDDDASDGGAAAADQHLATLGKAADIAAQLAEQHAAAAEKARLDQVVAKGGLDGWIAEALRIMDLPQSLAPSVKKIIMAESGGNPRAINNWDANARRGTPSQGLMQTIPVTFKKYVHPDLAGRSITDPVANITAGVRYMIDNYGMSTLQAGGRSNNAGEYVGY